MSSLGGLIKYSFMGPKINMLGGLRIYSGQKSNELGNYTVSGAMIGDNMLCVPVLQVLKLTKEITTSTLPL